MSVDEDIVEGEESVGRVEIEHSVLVEVAGLLDSEKKEENPVENPKVGPYSVRLK